MAPRWQVTDSGWGYYCSSVVRGMGSITSPPCRMTRRGGPEMGLSNSTTGAGSTVATELALRFTTHLGSRVSNVF